ncbi:mitochondrial carrier, partial [Neoconidiobolus thromboides FSU 785]
EIDPINQIKNSPYSSVLTGIARSVIMYPLYFWFRAPIKLFRPIRIDYLDLARALVPPEQMKKKSGQLINFRTTSIGLISHAVKKKGVKFIPKYVLPPMFINSFIGISLFATYDQTLPIFKNYFDQSTSFYLAGFMAGFSQSIIATPFDSIKIRMEAKQLLDGKHRNISTYYKSTLKQLGVSAAYRGFLLNCVKDSLGFAAFFGLFENSKRYLTDHYGIIKAPETKLTWGQVFKQGSIVVASGIIAGTGFQFIDYPLEKARTILLVRAGKMEINQPYFKKLYSGTAKQILKLIKREGARNFFFKGFGNSLYKAVPSTAVGFLCYEFISNHF